LTCRGLTRKTLDETLPKAIQVADPFHLVRLATDKLDEVRRRVQNELFRHRGRAGDPLYRARRLLTKAHERLERLDDKGDSKLRARDNRKAGAFAPALTCAFFSAGGRI